jgi:hypothetical protein
MITTDKFLQFWAKAIPNLQIHPDEAEALKSNRHNFMLDTMIGPFMGRLCTAPVVLLRLNPGDSKRGDEQREAQMPAVRQQMIDNLAGDAPLPNWATNPKGREWTEMQLRPFGVNYQTATDHVAFVNILAYRSRNGDGAGDKHMIDRLASCRITRAWARDTLFREAERGERVVVCLMSAAAWGLTVGTERGTLFAPPMTRGKMHHGPMREKVGLAIRRAVGLIAATSATRPTGTALSVPT